MPTYVKLTFTPAGTTKLRTTWAIQLPVRNGLARFIVCSKDGDTEINGKIELILLNNTKDKFITRPAKINLHYAELEVIQ